MTYVAVIKYPLDATDAIKKREIREGLAFAAAELINLGYSLEDLEMALEDAYSAGEEEARANAAHKRLRLGGRRRAHQHPSVLR